MTNQRQCERCGRPLNGATSDSICPACVAQLGQATWLGESATEAFEEHPQRRAEALHTQDPGTTRIRYFGDYELLEELARGGMGTVYRARQVSLNRPVALKLISAGALATPVLVKRFQAEAEVAASLTHPNIVPIFEIGQHDGQHYFSMGLVDGPSLRNHLNRRPMPTREAAALMATVARAVHYAHQWGVLHRDLKPGNIVLDRDGTPHLTDFGLAKLVEKESTLTHTNAVLGTPSYMAPEQARGAAKEVTTAADVYGLGAVLYEALTGHPPFAGGTSVETIRQVLDQEPRRPSLWNRAADRDLETICLKCLEKEPERRYASAAALADDLERWRSGQPILARPTAPWERALKWAGRKPAIASLMAAVVLVSAVGLTGVLWQWQSAVEGREQAKAERDAKSRALLRADGLRLAASSSEVLSVSPELALLLAIEAAQRHPSLEANIALQAAMDASHPFKELTGDGFDFGRLSFSADGKRLFSAQSLTFWDTETGEPLHGGPSDHGHQMAWLNSDGTLVCTMRINGPVRLWDATTGGQVLELEDRNVAWFSDPFSPDGKNLVTVDDDHAVRVLSLPGGDEIQVLSGHTGRIHLTASSPNGQKLATAAVDQIVRIWDMADGRTIRTLDWLVGQYSRSQRQPDGQPEGESITSLLWLSDNARLMTLSGDGVGRLWNTETGEELAVLNDLTASGVLKFPADVLITPDDKYLVSVGSRVSVIDLTSDGSRHSKRTWGAHPSWVRAFALSHDGKFLATGADDRTVRVWDIQSGDQVAQILGQPDNPCAIAFSPDGQLLAVRGDETSLRLWGLASGRELWSLGQDPIDSGSPVSLSTDGTTALTPPIPRWPLFLHDMEAGTIIELDGSATDGSFSGRGDLVFSSSGRLFDTFSGRQLIDLSAGTGRIRATALNPSGTWAASAGDSGLIQIWEARTGEKRMTLNDHHERVVDLEFSPDGTRLLSASADATARLWEVDSGQQLFALTGHHSGLKQASISPDATRIVTVAADGQAGLWHGIEGDLIGWLEDPLGIGSAAFNPGGLVLLTWRPSMNPVVRVWDAGTAHERFSLDHKLPVASACFSPDEQLILTVSADGVHLWAAEDGAHRLTLRTGSRRASHAWFSPDAREILISDHDGVTSYDRATGALIRKVFDHVVRPTLISPGPNGRFVLASGVSYPLHLWNLSSRTPIVDFKQSHADRVNDSDFTSDALRVATASSDGTVRIWEVATGHELVRFHVGGPFANVRFSPNDERIVTYNHAGVCAVWDAATGERIATLDNRVSESTGRTDQSEKLQPPDQEIRSAVFTPDGQRVVVVSVAMDEPGLVTPHRMRASLWNANTGDRLHAFDGVVRLAFPSPDGRHILLAGDDVRLVDAWTYEPVWRSPLPDPAAASAFSPDGELVSIACGPGQILVYTTQNGEERLRLRAPHGGLAGSVAFSQDGKRLITWAWGRNGIQVWDLPTGAQLLHLAPDDTILFAAFANHSQDIFAVIQSSPPRLWPVDPLHAALAMKPRELTLEERRVYELDLTFE